MKSLRYGSFYQKLSYCSTYVPISFYWIEIPNISRYMIKSIVFRLMLKRMIFNTIKMIFFFNFKMNMTSLLNLISEDLACCRFVGATCDSNTNHMTQNLEPTLILRVRDDCNPNHVEVSSVNTRYLIIRAPSEHSDTTARYLHGTYYSTIHGPLYIGHYTWATFVEPIGE